MRSTCISTSLWKRISRKERKYTSWGWTRASSTSAADTSWDRMVAMAAPATFRSRNTTNTTSSTMFTMQAAIR